MEYKQWEPYSELLTVRHYLLQIPLKDGYKPTKKSAMSKVIKTSSLNSVRPNNGAQGPSEVNQGDAPNNTIIRPTKQGSPVSNSSNSTIQSKGNSNAESTQVLIVL